MGRQKDTQNVTAKQATNSPVTITCDGEVIATYIVKEPSDRRINIRFDLNGGQGTKPETIVVTGYLQATVFHVPVTNFLDGVNLNRVE